jgi:DNA polymerase III sliding clamp (beta) subunit (PCNA family)
VGRGDLVQAIQALSAVRFGKTSAIKLTFPKGKICCELNCPELGKSIFDCDAEHDLPTDFHIGLNGGYLLSMLAALTGEEVTLQMSDPMAPLVITDPADTAFKGVIMPMRG